MACSRPLRANFEQASQGIDVARRDGEIRVIEEVLRTALVHGGKSRHLHQQRHQAIHVALASRVRNGSPESGVPNGLLTHCAFNCRG